METKTNEKKVDKETVKRNALLGVGLLVLGAILYFAISKVVGIFPVLAGAIISAYTLHNATKLKEQEAKE